MPVTRIGRRPRPLVAGTRPAAQRDGHARRRSLTGRPAESAWRAGPAEPDPVDRAEVVELLVGVVEGEAVEGEAGAKA